MIKRPQNTKFYSEVIGDVKGLEIIWLPTPPGSPHEIAGISYIKDDQRHTLILKMSGDDVLEMFG